jgi:hypothetical protein
MKESTKAIRSGQTLDIGRIAAVGYFLALARTYTRIGYGQPVSAAFPKWNATQATDASYTDLGNSTSKSIYQRIGYRAGKIALQRCVAAEEA